VAWPRSAAAAESSASGCGNVVGVTSILDRGHFFLVYLYKTTKALTKTVSSTHINLQ